ncbi:MAG: hypothetical protein JNL70_19375 [Saprospiraceae bacterium]|nr:hypothetical protein [Saprospiraceae bacterium]
MKKLLILWAILITGCNNPNQSIQKWRVVDSLKNETTKIDTPIIPKPQMAQQIGNPKFYTQKDSIKIGIDKDDEFIISKNDFNRIVDLFPELYSEDIAHPDLVYYKSPRVKHYVDENGLDETISFNSELGQDEFFMLYAYFLIQKNKNLDTQREKLNDIYQTINELFGRLQRGGTYFGHQSRRIMGFTEFAMYQYANNGRFYETKYDISSQKKLFLESLMQIIKDLVSVSTPQTLRKEEENKFRPYIKKLDTLITDYFYLTEARSFQYEYYNY